MFEPPGRGIRRDFSRRRPHYRSDWTDGIFSAQAAAGALFLFFACLAPAVGFGGACQAATAGQMGVLEMCASTALCGAAYAAAAPQPMQLVGVVRRRRAKEQKCCFWGSRPVRSWSFY